MRVTKAIAGIEAARMAGKKAKAGTAKAGMAISVGFNPVQFLNDYLRLYWLSTPEDRTAVERDEASIVRNMQKDLENLMNAIESYVGP